MSRLNKNRKIKASINKTGVLHFNKICRSCLTERGHLRDLFSTRLPLMIKTCTEIKVAENDTLPNKICASCFYQIAKLYSFKKMLERNDKILRNYLKVQKQNSTSECSDILHKAVNEADIAGNDGKSAAREETDCSDDENVPLSERIQHDKRTSNSLVRKSKQKANKMIDEIIASEDDSEHGSEVCSEEESKPTSIFESVFYNNDPPPLVPLVLTKATNSVDSTSKSLPQNAPPLVPIKSITSLNPTTIVNALGDNIENSVELKLQCNVCNEEFNSVFALKNHRLNHCQASNMQCNICKKEFNDRMRLISHLKGHMVSKDYACKICGKRYPNPSTFQVHMRTHTGERPFKCQVCDKGFVRWAGVVGHMKTHNTVKPYKCETCGKGFKITSNLERHKILHSGILPYCCSYCGKTFSQSDNLQLHVRTYHTNDRPYLCSECGKRFVSSTRLKRHMWVHTGFKPYRCRFCPKAYSNSNDRKHHERSHTGGTKDSDKPYACSTCDMRFLHPCRLSKHMKTHERPFPCDECTKTFSSENLLSKHKNSKHGPLDHLSVPMTVEEVYINY